MTDNCNQKKDLLVGIPGLRASSPGNWGVDVALAAAVLAVLVAVRPCAPDGDGMYHAGRAIERSFRDGMVAKHPLYAAVLRALYLVLDAVGLRSWVLDAFAIVSCSCGAALYLLLARGLFAPLLRDVGLARIAAIGTLASYGVMQSCCSIETYAPALLCDVALVTACWYWDVATPRGGVLAGGLFVLAVGMHAANVLLAPFLIAVLWLRARNRPWHGAFWAVGTVALGGLMIAVLLAGWPPDLTRLLPHADPEPALGVAGRLGRAAYGWLRTFVWLPPSWELTKFYAAGYAVGLVVVLGLAALVAWRGCALRRRTGVLALASLVAIPFVGMGIAYFPSDPERWLFLVPIAWLVAGWIWADYQPPATAWLTPGVARGMLVVVVAGVAVVNVAVKLWPEARHNRERQGAVRLAAIVQENDLIIAPSQLSLTYQEFVIGRFLNAEILPLDMLMLHEQPHDVKAGQDILRQRVQSALAEGRRVFVTALLGEKLQPGRGYPWAWVEPAGYTPESVLGVLREFQVDEAVPATPEHTGTYRLRPQPRDPDPFDDRFMPP
ncbi:MAG: hypothetical protein NZO58_01160 [Gemmataceae bacterium]|nr:hypothetical protein [Gemmataceae bacterium]